MKKALLFLFMLSCFAGCKKFPDGPLISFRSVTKRIEGTYKVEKFFINGNDSTAEFNTKLGNLIEFSKTITAYNAENFYLYLTNSNNGKSYTGAWRYIKHSSYIGFGFVTDTTMKNGIGPFGFPRDDSGVKILRLTNKEFNFEAYDPGYGLWGSNPAGTPYIINLVKQ